MKLFPIGYYFQFFCICEMLLSIINYCVYGILLFVVCCHGKQTLSSLYIRLRPVSNRWIPKKLSLSSSYLMVEFMKFFFCFLLFYQLSKCCSNYFVYKFSIFLTKPFFTLKNLFFWFSVSIPLNTIESRGKIEHFSLCS